MKGIGVAGTMLVDKIYGIERYPKAGELTKINDITQAVGGCVPNVACDIKAVTPEIPVYAFGRLGTDPEGEFVLKRLKEAGVDTRNIVFGKEKTSFTEVMSIAGGERTFFSYSGANAEFCRKDVGLRQADVAMLHVGYFLLLEKADNGDGLEILKSARARGIKTSIDLVSEDPVAYAKVLPCLEYVDNLIINEIEAENLAGISAPLRLVAERLKSLGVKERVIIHKPDLSVCFSENGFCVVPSYELPDGFIKGSTGAGDAFCAGALIGIYEGADDKSILEFASKTAVASLSHADAVNGMRERREIEKLCNNFKRRNLCL